MANYINTLNKRLSTEEQQTNALFIRDYLVAKGWSVNAIAGLLGNWQAESRINPNVYEGYEMHSSDLGSYGYGLSQWTPWLGTSTYDTAEEQRHYHGSNNPTFGRWCLDNGRDKSLMETQLDYVNTGLGGYRIVTGYPETYAQFKVSTKAADYLAQLYYVNYERSAAGQWGDRPKYALEWYAYLTGNPGSGGGTVDPPTVKPGYRYCNVTEGQYVNIRSGPGTTYGVVDILHRGDAVYVLSIVDGWAQISEPVNGYVMASYLQEESIGTGSTPVNKDMYCNVAAGQYVNIRSGPSTSDGVVGILHRGDVVHVESIAEGWAKITSPVAGYVMLSFLQYEKPDWGGGGDGPDYPFCPPECTTDFLRRYILFYKGRGRRVVR